jgi:hypothetical protein
MSGMVTAFLACEEQTAAASTNSTLLSSWTLASLTPCSTISEDYDAALDPPSSSTQSVLTLQLAGLLIPQSVASQGDHNAISHDQKTTTTSQFSNSSYPQNLTCSDAQSTMAPNNQATAVALAAGEGQSVLTSHVTLSDICKATSEKEQSIVTTVSSI